MLEKMVDRRLVNIPIIVSILYLFSTVILFFFGPIKWRISNEIELLSYVSLAYGLFYFGFKFYQLKHKKYLSKFTFESRLSRNVLILFRISCLFMIISYAAFFIVLGNVTSIDQLLKPGDLYFDRINSSVSYNPLLQKLTWIWVLNTIPIPLGLYYYKDLKPIDKGLFILAISTNILYWIGTGTSKGLGDIVITALPVILYKYYDKPRLMNTETSKKTKSRGKNRVRITILFILLVTIFITIFNTNQKSRSESMGIQSRTVTNAVTYRFIDSEYTLPFNMNFLIFYTTHGYVGLAYSLEQPFIANYGVGFSRTLTEVASNRLNQDLSWKTYTARIENAYGWYNGILWSTALPWYANDITWSGVLILMIFIGYFFSYCWSIFIIEKRIIGLILVSQIFIFVIFLPSNNQLFQGRQALFSSVALLGILFFQNILRSLNRDKHNSNLLSVNATTRIK